MVGLAFHLDNTITNMSDLSDLDLVAQAMASSDKPQKSNPIPKTQNPPSKTKPTEPTPDQPDLDLGPDNLDLSSLTPEDLALLQPLLSALSMSDADVLDENTLADVWKQMNAADEVADDLEGKLDRLIGELGRVEEGILDDMGDKSKNEAETGDQGEKKSEKGGDVGTDTDMSGGTDTSTTEKK